MVGKARSFSNEANEIVFQTESNNENFALGSQQNSYNLGSVHFSDQSGIGNFSQSGKNSKFAQVKGSLFQGNIGFVQQTVELDVGTSTINLNNDSAGVALAVISQDRIVTLSAGFTSDLTTITGAQRQGQRFTLYNIFSNTITIKNNAGATVNTIVTPGAVDFSLSGHGVVTFVFDISLAQWRIEGNLGSGGGGITLPVVDTTAIVKGSVDATKLMRFEVDTLVPTATTVVLTVPAADTTLAGLSISPQTFSGITTFTGSSFSVTSSVIILGDEITDTINVGGRIGTDIIPIADADDDLGTNVLRWDNIFGVNVIASTVTASVSLSSTGSTFLGDAITDTISFGGRINTDIIPILDADDDLGTNVLRWNNIFGVSVIANTVTASVSLSSTGTTILGDDIADTISFGGRVNTDIIPILDADDDLGTNVLRWNNIFGISVIANTVNASVSFSSTGTTTLGDDASDNINFGGQINTQMVIKEITEPATPPANTLTLYGKLDGGFTKLFYKQEDGTEVGPLSAGAASQTPWLSTIDADSNDLENLGRTEYATGLFGASTDPFSVYDGTNLRWHVPTSGGFVWTIGAFDQILGLGPSVVNVFKVLDMQNANKIINVNDPTADQDVVTRKFLEDNPTIPQGVQDTRIWTDHETAEFNFEVWLTNNKNGDLGSSVPLAEDVAFYIPIWVGDNVTLREIGIDVTVAGVATVTLAIYDSEDGQNYPRTRIDFDTSTNGISLGTGIRSLTFFEALAPGLYWLLVRTDTGISIRQWNPDGAVSVGHFPAGGVTGAMAPISGYFDDLTSSTPDATADNDMSVLNGNTQVGIPAIYGRFD